MLLQKYTYQSMYLTNMLSFLHQIVIYFHTPFFILHYFAIALTLPAKWPDAKSKLSQGVCRLPSCWLISGSCSGPGFLSISREICKPSKAGRSDQFRLSFLFTQSQAKCLCNSCLHSAWVIKMVQGGSTGCSDLSV